MIVRKFPIGSEWLYLKFFGGPVFLEKFLLNDIYPCLEYFKDLNLIDKWFFIRYSEGGFHFRLRIHLTKVDFIHMILNRFNEISNGYIESHLIWRIQADQYNREIERYGLETVSISEDFFNIDSEIIVSFFQHINVHSSNDYKLRWLFAIFMINKTMDLFFYSLDYKILLLDRLRDFYISSFGYNKEIFKQLSSKFRNNKNDIFDFLTDQNLFLNDLHLLEMINISFLKKEELLNNFFEINKSQIRSIDLDSYFSSLIHMSMNRIFKTKPNINEMVCYDLLSQTLKSKRAREKGGSIFLF